MDSSLPPEHDDDQRRQLRLEEHLNRLAHLSELPMRCALTGELLREWPAEDLSWGLGEILRGALWGQPSHTDAMLALSLYLIAQQIDDQYDFFQDLFTKLHQGGREELLFFCRDTPPQRQLPKGSRLPEARLPLERDVSLGERRAMAAGSNRRYLERLLMDPNPLVIAKLMQNSALLPQDVLVIASRRPTLNALLMPIASSWRWLQHHDIREALARNPFIATGIALKLLPTLQVRTLRQIKDSGDLHPGVVRFAQLLVEIHQWRVSEPA